MYGLDRPLLTQFWSYLVGLGHFDLGRSLVSHRLVTSLIVERLPWTMGLVGSAVLLSVLIGAVLGTGAAWRPHGRLTRLVGAVVIGVGALPEFLVAMILIAALGTGLRLFPAGGATTPFLAARPGGWARAVADVLWHGALPIATLLVGLIPAFYLLTRNTLAAESGARYLLTARGKGLPERGVMWQAWRNALSPVLTLLGLRLAFAVTGAAVVERLFAYPGIGLLLFEAIGRRDYPVMQGVFLVASVAMLGTNLLLDLSAAMLDPRLSQEQR
jgi:peptide/nickel transport system permease protein